MARLIAPVRRAPLLLTGKLRVAAFPRGAGVALGAFAIVLGLAAANGGYFPTSWGWITVLSLWAAALALIVRASERPSRLETVFLGGLACLAGWIALTALWAPSVTDAFVELQRALVYVSAVLALVLLARRDAVVPLLAGALAGIAAAGGYGLATRLVPERLGTFDPVAGYRLAEPVGYWNGLGLLSAIGVLLALGFAARASSTAARASAAAAATTVLLPVLYFTFGRGPWIALGVGLLAMLALDGRRLQLVATTAAIAPWAAAAVWLCSRSPALTRIDTELADASAQGHRLGLMLLALGVGAALSTLALAWLERRLAPGERVRIAIAGLLIAVAVSALVAGAVRAGGPVAIAASAQRAFTSPPPSVSADLNDRLFSFSGNGRADLWEVALEQAAAHPLAGAGAGSYEAAWLERRELNLKVRDAHSLYLETAAELGAPGLLLLLTALLAPVAAAIRARSHPLVPAAFAAYAAFLVHAGADWDWELAGVTVAGLLCGGALLLAGRSQRAPLALPSRLALLGGAIALLPIATVGLLGSSAIAASADAAAEANWTEAKAQARRAVRFAPWSSEPLQRLGEAQLAQGELEAAQDSFDRAIAKDPRDWSLWLDLARASEGDARQRALVRSAALNPLSIEIARLRTEFELEETATAAP